MLLDVERWPEWTTSVSKVQRMDIGPLTLGSRTRIWQPKLMPAVWQVTSLDEQRHIFAWTTHTFGIKIIARHQVDAIGARSRVTLSPHLLRRRRSRPGPRLPRPQLGLPRPRSQRPPRPLRSPGSSPRAGAVSGQWTVVSGQWSVVSGQWTVDSGQWSVVSGQWSVVSGQWTVDSGQWTVVSEQSSA